MGSLEQRWQVLLDRVFADFSDDLILSEARRTLEAMDYRVKQNGGRQIIPHDVSLLIVRRSLHRDPDTRLGGYLTFDVAVGPHFTEAGRFNGLCDYGVIRLEFGIDGAFQDETFTPSLLWQPGEPSSEVSVEMASTVIAESSEKYNEKGAQMGQGNSILDSVQWDADSGAITFKDVRYMLIRPDTVVDFQKAVEAEVGMEKCAEMMMAGGYTGGSRSSKRYKEVFDYTDGEIVAFMCQMGGEIGWGKFNVIKLDVLAKEFIVEVENSAFAAAYGEADQGVCHMIRGVMAGMAVGIFGGDVASEETLCRSKGDDRCRFEIRG